MTTILTALGNALIFAALAIFIAGMLSGCAATVAMGRMLGR